LSCICPKSDALFCFEVDELYNGSRTNLGLTIQCTDMVIIEDIVG